MDNEVRLETVQRSGQLLTQGIKVLHPIDPAR
jgi:hypothetical protein